MAKLAEICHKKMFLLTYLSYICGKANVMKIFRYFSPLPYKYSQVFSKRIIWNTPEVIPHRYDVLGRMMCWARLAYGGPALRQHWFSFTYFLAKDTLSTNSMYTRIFIAKKEKKLKRSATRGHWSL